MHGKDLSLKIHRRFGVFTLDTALDVRIEGVTALFGPSGSGKSSLLRIIAGLDREAVGHVSFAGEIWQDTEARQFVPAHKRPVGLGFQDARLFTHLNVRGNLRFAERRQKAFSSAISSDTVIEALDLHPLLERDTRSLSGGERQRVALGRTLLSGPKLLLLDEPLSALDHARKAAILPYLIHAPARFGIPTLFVSHAIEEIAQIASQVVVITDGQVVAQGETSTVLSRIELQRITGRFEAGAILSGRIAAHDASLSLTQVQLDPTGDTPETGGPSLLTMPQITGLRLGEPVRLRVRARDVALALEKPQGISIRNILHCVVQQIRAEPDTAFAEITLLLSGQVLRARITRAAVDDMALAEGQPVYALIKSASFDRRGLGARVD